MRHAVRTVFVWLLLLALPAQALASLGMQLCEQVHDHAGHAAHQQIDAQSPGSHHDAGKADVAADASADASLCALCAFCVGAATPVRPFETSSAPLAGGPPLEGAQRLVRALVEMPERPPRHTFIPAD